MKLFARQVGDAGAGCPGHVAVPRAAAAAGDAPGTPGVPRPLLLLRHWSLHEQRYQEPQEIRADVQCARWEIVSDNLTSIFDCWFDPTCTNPHPYEAVLHSFMCIKSWAHAERHKTRH